MLPMRRVRLWFLKMFRKKGGDGWIFTHHTKPRQAVVCVPRQRRGLSQYHKKTGKNGKTQRTE